MGEETESGDHPVSGEERGIDERVVSKGIAGREKWSSCGYMHMCGRGKDGGGMEKEFCSTVKASCPSARDRP